jgi:hypothetical protein
MSDANARRDDVLELFTIYAHPADHPKERSSMSSLHEIPVVPSTTGPVVPPTTQTSHPPRAVMESALADDADKLAADVEAELLRESHEPLAVKARQLRSIRRRADADASQRGQRPIDDEPSAGLVRPRNDTSGRRDGVDQVERVMSDLPESRALKKLRAAIDLLHEIRNHSDSSFVHAFFAAWPEAADDPELRRLILDSLSAATTTLEYLAGVLAGGNESGRSEG